MKLINPNPVLLTKDKVQIVDILKDLCRQVLDDLEAKHPELKKGKSK